MNNGDETLSHYATDVSTTSLHQTRKSRTALLPRQPSNPNRESRSSSSQATTMTADASFDDSNASRSTTCDDNMTHPTHEQQPPPKRTTRQSQRFQWRHAANLAKETAMMAELANTNTRIIQMQRDINTRMLALHQANNGNPSMMMQLMAQQPDWPTNGTSIYRQGTMTMMEQAPGYNMWQHDACNNVNTTNSFPVWKGTRR